jgi:hypothetical protein
MGKENTERDIWPSNRKLRVDICTNQRLRWLGHAERMQEKRNVKKVFKNIPEGRRSAEKSRKRWLKIIRRKRVLEAGEK